MAPFGKFRCKKGVKVKSEIRVMEVGFLGHTLYEKLQKKQRLKFQRWGGWVNWCLFYVFQLNFFWYALRKSSKHFKLLKSNVIMAIFKSNNFIILKA